jgi:hypothetical protein
MEQGEIAFSWNDQFDNHLRRYDSRRPVTDTDDYIVGVGFLPNFEFQGRLKNQPGYARDLSANFKARVPRGLYGEWLRDWMPDIAVGVQDAGSAANLYENYYVVADKLWWGRLRTSVGYGYSRSSRAPRMDGLFGGAEGFVTPWLSVLGEYDGRESHAAVRVRTPESWSKRFHLDATLASNLSDGNRMSLMLSGIFRFDVTDEPRQREKLDLQTLSARVEALSAAEEDWFDARDQRPKSPEEERRLIRELAETLAAEGLENISIRTDEERSVLVIAYENHVYRHNELDAMGAVLHHAARLAPYYDNFVLEPKKSGVVLRSVSGSLVMAALAVERPSPGHTQALAGSLSQSRDAIVMGRSRIEDFNDARFKTRIELTPMLTYMVGTEVGVFDYQLLLGSTASWNIAKGVDASVRYDTPISRSDEFDPHGGHFGYLYNDGGLDSVMLHHTSNLYGIHNLASAGLYDYDYYGVYDQASYVYGNHIFGVEGGYFRHRDFADRDKAVFLASYTYSYAPMDVQFEIQGGQYWYQDQGFSLELKRYFGDVAVSLKYLQTWPDGVSGNLENTNRYVGVYFEVPLDFRKSKSDWRLLQLRGDSAWKKGLRSTVARNDGTNTIVPSSGKIPLMPLRNYSELENRNRSTLDYLKMHVDRLVRP